MTTGSQITAPDLASLIEMHDALSEFEAVNLGEEFAGKDGPDQPPIITIPKGREVKDLTDIYERWFGPRVVRQSVEFFDVSSVIDYLNRFKVDGETSVFIFPGRDADEEKKIPALPPSLRAVINYHGQGGKAGRATHVVTYKFPISAEVSAWMEIDGESLDQAEVVAHLLDRENDIVNPPMSWMCVPPEIVAEIANALNLSDDLAPRDEAGNYIIPEGLDPDADGRIEEEDERYVPRTALAKLGEIRFAGLHTMKRLAANLEMTSSARATSSLDHKTGARSVEFVDDRDTKIAGKKVTLPDLFLLRVPLFVNDAPTLLPVRPVVRMRGGGIKWGFLLAHLNRVIGRRVARVGEEIARETGVPVYLGSLPTV